MMLALKIAVCGALVALTVGMVIKFEQESELTFESSKSKDLLLSLFCDINLKYF